MTRYSQTMKEVLMEVRGLLDENAFKKLQFVAKDLAKLAAKDKKGMDYKDYMKAAAMMKTGKVKELKKFVNDLDTFPREVIVMRVAKEMGNAAAERIFDVRINESAPCPECGNETCTCDVVEAFASRRPGNQMSDLYKLYSMAMKTVPGSKQQKEIEKKISMLRKELKLDEKLGKDADAGDYIDDFKKSDAPQFKGKSDKKKKDMAIAAYLDAKDKKEEVELDEDADKSLAKKAKASGISLGILKQVYKRGIAAWRTGHRPGTTPAQWAHARVNSFISGGKTRTTGDADLWKKHKGKSEELEEGKVYIYREYEPGQYFEGDLKQLQTDIKKAGGKILDIEKPTRREPNLSIEADGDYKRIKREIEKNDDGLTAVEEETIKEEPEKKMDKPDSAKAVDQMRDDKKKTRIAQLQLQIAKATEMINKLNSQEKPDA